MAEQGNLGLVPPNMNNEWTSKNWQSSPKLSPPGGGLVKEGSSFAGREHWLFKLPTYHPCTSDHRPNGWHPELLLWPGGELQTSELGLWVSPVGQLSTCTSVAKFSLCFDSAVTGRGRLSRWLVSKALQGTSIGSSSLEQEMTVISCPKWAVDKLRSLERNRMKKEVCGNKGF